MKIAIIDLDSVCYTIAHPEKELDEQGNPRRTEDGKRFIYKEKTFEQMAVDADKVLKMILEESGATHWIGYMKGINTTLTRLEVNPDYKGNRNKEEPWWWNDVQLTLLNRGAHYVDYMEVDDAVNITRLALPNSFICAIDNDLLGLEGTHYNWRKKEWVTMSNTEANRKFWSDMIAGQSGDNIKGLPGKGQKYADNLFTKINYHLDVEYAELVFSAYLLHYDNTYNALEEYHKNYVSLKILDKKEGFIIPEPIKVPKNEEIKSELFT